MRRNVGTDLQHEIPGQRPMDPECTRVHDIPVYFPVGSMEIHIGPEANMGSPEQVSHSDMD